MSRGVSLVQSNKALTSILLLAFFLPLIYSFSFRIHPVVDAKAYDRIAINLVEGFGFREDRETGYERDKAILRAGPGYEFFLAGVYTLFGHHYEPVWIIQAILHAASAWLIYGTAARVWKNRGKSIGLVGAGLFAISPDLIEIAAMLMTETVYLFFTILTVYLFVRIFEQPQKRFLGLLGGIITGLAVLTRPPIVLFIPVFLFLYWRKKQFVPLGMFFVGVLIVLSPWVIRNYGVYHEFMLTTLIGSYNLWIGNTLLSNGGQIAGGFNPIEGYVDTHGVFGLKQQATREFFSFVFQYPLLFIKLTFLRCIRFFSLIRPMGFWFYQTGIGQLTLIGSSVVWIVVLFTTGFAGLTRALKEKKELWYYLAVFAATSPLALLPTVVQSRYRFQIYPFLALFAGYLIVSWRVDKTLWREKAVWMPILFLVLISFADVLLSFGTVVERVGRWF